MLNVLVDAVELLSPWLRLTLISASPPCGPVLFAYGNRAGRKCATPYVPRERGSLPIDDHDFTQVHVVPADMLPSFPLAVKATRARSDRSGFSPVMNTLTSGYRCTSCSMDPSACKGMICASMWKHTTEMKSCGEFISHFVDTREIQTAT